MFSLDRVIGLIAPYQCLICGEDGRLLCDWCKVDALMPVPARCYRCQAQSPDSATCRKCRRHSQLSNVWPCTYHDELPKRLIYKLKFERAREASKVISDLIDARLPYLSEDILVTHVPTAASRRRQRGYDHAELIARCLAKQRKLEFATLLARLGHSRQVGSSRQLRQSQLKNAFRIRRPNLISKRKILLVDDVVTTGATLEAAARTLKQAGAAKVYAATFTQKL